MLTLIVYALLVLITILIAPAFSQDSTVEMGGFLGWLRPYVMEVVTIVIGAAITWASKRFHDLSGMEIEARHREALQSALRNGAALVVDRIPVDVTVDVKSPALARGIRYVLESVPDAVEFFGLTPDKIAALLLPKVVAQPTVIIESPK